MMLINLFYSITLEYHHPTMKPGAPSSGVRGEASAENEFDAIYSCYTESHTTAK